MADLDLATILADGEYLKREGDTLVGEIPAAGGGSGSTILDGTGPPDVALGAVGNYYEDRTAGVLYGPKTASGWGTPQQPTMASTPNLDGITDEQGARYRFARAGRVTGGRYRRMATSAGTLTLKAWRDSTTLKVAEIADVQSTTGPFTVTFPTPVIVEANETLTFTMGTTGNNPYRTGAPTMTNTADVTYVESRQNSTLDVYPNVVQVVTYYVEPVFEPNEAWPVTVRTVAGYQAVTSSLTDLATNWIPASAAGPAVLQMFEDTDNGTNKVILSAPATIGSDFTVTVPGANGTVCLTQPAQTLLLKTIALGSNTVTGTIAEFNTACTDADFATTTRTIVTYSAVSNTAVLTDGGKYVRFTGTNPTYTVPPNSAVAFPVGTQIDGIGTATAMTLIAGAGVTITKARTLVTLGAGSGWTLIKTGTDAWDLHGDLV